MSDLCTLEQLRDHARSNADHEYNLSGCGTCLAATLVGRLMSDERHFSIPSDWFNPDFDSTVPEPFALFTVAADYGHYTGAQLADAIEKLIAGACPHQVGSDLKGNHAIHSA